VRQPAHRAGKFCRAGKKLGKKLNDARNSFFPENEHYTSGVENPTNFAKRSVAKLDISIFRFFIPFACQKSQDMMGVRTFSGLVAKLKMLGRM